MGQLRLAGVQAVDAPRGAARRPVFRLWMPPVALLAGPCSCSQARVQAVDACPL